MNEPVQIVGQGMAGSMLAWQLERAGTPFRIFDRGHAVAASRVGAGLVSPLTGRRLVPTWGFAAWRDDVLRDYRELEDELGIEIVREMRIRRRFRDAAQRELFEQRTRVPEVARWVEGIDESGLWLRGALQVETGKLIAALRRRWLDLGCLEEREMVDSGESSIPTIWCVGAGDMPLDKIPWEPSRGELIVGELDGLAEDVVLNDGQWLLPLGGGEVRVGSTFDRVDLQSGSTAEGVAQLKTAATRLAGKPLTNVRGEAGLRVTVPDRRPVVGWVDEGKTMGVLAGLAAKGALWAPALARQWAADGLAGDHLHQAVRATRYNR